MCVCVCSFHSEFESFTFCFEDIYIFKTKSVSLFHRVGHFCYFEHLMQIYLFEALKITLLLSIYTFV